MLTSFSHLAQLVSDTTQITKAAILHMFLTMDKVKTDKILSYLLCCVSVYHHQIEAREKKSVFVWAVTRALWLPAFECRCHAEFAPS
jgi:hypothetical protein